MSASNSEIHIENSPKTFPKPQLTIENSPTCKKQNINSSQKIAPCTQAEKPKSKNIFSQGFQKVKVYNIFAQGTETAQRKNIFASSLNSVNLFNISTLPKSQNQNIFKSASKTKVKNLSQDDDQSSSNFDSNSVTKIQTEFKSRPLQLVMKFKYQNPWTVIKTYNLKKFKNGVNPSKQFIYLTFEKHSEQPDKTHIFVRSRQTKVILFQGFGVKGISDKISTFMNREDNLKFTVIKNSKKQNQDNEKLEIVREEVKIQFETVEDATEFKEFMKKEYGQEDKEAEKSEKKI